MIKRYNGGNRIVPFRTFDGMFFEVNNRQMQLYFDAMVKSWKDWDDWVNDIIPD